MKSIFSIIQLVALTTWCFAQAPEPYGPVPTTAQLNWHEMEMYCIIHYGVDTYTDKEWGFGDESPKLINPVNFSAVQILNAVKAGGFKGVVVVAKHHDGLCLWPTRTTTHNISQSFWKEGKGDMVKEYQQACSKLDIQLGLYCSPWDRNNSLYGKPEYLKIYQEQLRELNSNYGPVFISWHDGANGGTGYYGGDKGERKIDRSTYYNWPQTWGIVRKLQPGAVIFGDVGPDVRWVGNEEGAAGETCWATYTPEAPIPEQTPSNGLSQYWKATEGTKNGKFWMPAECDVPMRPGWFYHASQNDKVKTAGELMKLYYQSVGRGANLNLGIAPNPDGQLDARDVYELKKFGSIIKKTFQHNLLKNASLIPSNVRAQKIGLYGAEKLVDKDRYSYWTTDEQVFTPSLTATFAKSQQFNVIQLRENIKLGQRIRAFSVDVFENNTWKEIAQGTSIGANRLIRLEGAGVKTTKIRLRITKSDACIVLSHFGIYNEPAPAGLPVISRDAQGIISISADTKQIVYYTLNGDQPNLHSNKYVNSFDFSTGGKVKAIAVDQSGEVSEVSFREFDQSKKGWRIVNSSPAKDGNAMLAIDDNASSAWLVNFEGALESPHQIVVDMGIIKEVNAFTFLPAIGHKAIVDGYQIEASTDGINWEKLISGEIPNIKSNPVEQIFPLKKGVQLRYFKFLVTHVIGTERFGIAELGVK